MKVVCVCPSYAVDFHVPFQVIEIIRGGWAESGVGVPEGEAVVDEAIGVDEARMA